MAADVATADHDAVLAANRAFYRAFVERDLAAMATLWSEDGAVACIHPGWDVLVGRAAVLASWRDIFAQPTAIACRDARVLAHGDCACVICHETIGDGRGGGMLVATNLFVRQDGAWRLIHHQAGGVAPGAPAPPAAPATRLH
ncbi:MAG: nuclear transport factor 2 family protein [Proteobacteria bacterium]|nr:nuclear transport factor 2 family protein [Pseudomonadota bacterium]